MDYLKTLDALAAFGVGLVIFLVLIIIAALVLVVIGQWKVFKKAGKGGWEAIVPFYNDWTLVKICGLEWWFFLILISGSICQLLGISGLFGLCTLAGLAANFFCGYNLAKKFGKDPVGFAIGLTLLPIVFYPILGFGKNNVFNDVPVSKYGPVEDKNASANPQQPEPSVQPQQSTSSEVFCSSCGAKVAAGSKFCTNCGKEMH